MHEIEDDFVSKALITAIFYHSLTQKKRQNTVIIEKFSQYRFEFQGFPRRLVEGLSRGLWTF